MNEIEIICVLIREFPHIGNKPVQVARIRWSEFLQLRDARKGQVRLLLHRTNGVRHLLNILIASIRASTSARIGNREMFTVLRAQLS